MHIPTNTPRVHGLTTPTHARRRAGHPAVAGGRLGKQNGVRAILGILVSSSRENMRILADILIRQFLNDVHARSRHFYAERLQGFQDEDSPDSKSQ